MKERVKLTRKIAALFNFYPLEGVFTFNCYTIAIHASWGVSLLYLCVVENRFIESERCVFINKC